MKIDYFIVFLISLFLFGCSPLDEEGSGIPIKLKAVINQDGIELPDNAFTKENPIHVIGYVRDNCGPYNVMFESDAYVNKKGELTLIGKSYEWPGFNMIFCAYWPADANVELDRGLLIQGDCILFGCSQPLNHYMTTDKMVVILYPNISKAIHEN